MEIYDHPTFHMACQQFDLVAERLQILEKDRARLKFPKRSMVVALPIHCDDGSVIRRSETQSKSRKKAPNFPSN